MLEAALEALVWLFEPRTFGYMVMGIVVGLSVGIIPGMSGVVGMSVLLPFIFGMEAHTGLAMMIGMAAVTHTSDTFPSVLIGVPGSAGSQATIMDGYPLAQQGRAGEALGASFSASMIGGLAGAVLLFGLIYVARPIVLAFASPELLMLTLLGLSTVGILSVRNGLAGLTIALFGLILGSVGAAPATATFRYTFGSFYLWEGIPLVVLTLGLFAFPEIIDLLARKRPIASAPIEKGGTWRGFRETLKHRGLVVRSSLVGTAVGIIPGLGGAVVDWISYTLAKQTVRDNSMFGRGDIRGVIAPESSNNAKDAGALVPTILFGVPGSATTAVLLGAVVLLGFDVGPTMLEENLSLTFVIVWSFALATVLGTAACLGLTRFVTKIVAVPADRLMPFIIVFVAVAAFQGSHSIIDVALFFGIGVLGWIMKQVGWPRPPLLIGFVLSIPAERYLWITMSRYQWTWLTRPGVLIIGLLIVAMLVYGLRSARGASSVQDLAAVDGDA